MQVRRGSNMAEKFNIKAWQDKHDAEGRTKGGIINNVTSSKPEKLTEKKKLLKRKK